MCEVKYEQLVLDFFFECYSNSEDFVFVLLVCWNCCWSKIICLYLVIEVDVKVFFVYDGVQVFLIRIWWGDMVVGMFILWLLGVFFCFVFVYINFIIFSEEVFLRIGLEDLQELDSLDMEKSLLYGLYSWVEEMVEVLRVQGG